MKKSLLFFSIALFFIQLHQAVAADLPPSPPPPPKADENTPYGQFVLGVNYFNTQKYEQAIYWWEKAAKKGNAQAASSLGNSYSKGYGVSQDHEKAVQWWQIAADKDLRYAQLMLGNAYHEGKGINRDDSKAVYWWEKVAAKEVVTDSDVQTAKHALHQLVDAYRNGEGVEKDTKHADELLEKVKPLDAEGNYCCPRSWGANKDGIAVLR